MRRTWIVIAMLAGCVGNDASEPISVFGAPPTPGREPQGTQMLGANVDSNTASSKAGNYYSLSNSGTLNSIAVTLSVDDLGQLVATAGSKSKRGSDLKNLLVTGSDGRMLMVQDWSARDPGQELPDRYTLVDAGTLKSVCSEYAVFFNDEFTRDRRHVAPPTAAANRLSYGCEDGVAVKCVRWGYIPDAVPYSDKWKLHQACTRMANADYCGTGDPGTHDGTYISMFDNAGVRAQVPTAPPGLMPWKLGPHMWPPPQGEYWLESRWTEKGATCLSRARWYSQDDNGPCPIQLPDPRKQRSGGEFCDDMSDAELIGTGPVLLSVSQFNDIPLYDWKNADGDLIATVRGYPSHVDPTLPNGDTSMQPVGPTKTSILRATTDEWNNDTEHMLDQLNMFCVPGTDRCTLAPVGTTGMDDKGFEGYVFVAKQKGLKELDTFEGALPNGNVDDLATPVKAAPTGYTKSATLGYVFAM